MTGPPSHTPVYTHRDLAALVANHDREHPDHTDECGCQNGLIATLRIYFAPTMPVVNDGPPPYVPPDVLSPRTPDASEHQQWLKHKPWLAPRDGETKAEYDFRISHSCYNCGTFIVDSVALSQHEDQCSLRGRRHDG